VIQTLNHNNQSEVLRSSFLSNGEAPLLQFVTDLGMICTCGSDGNAILWNQCTSSNSSSYSQVLTLPHHDQIYACVTSEGISSPHVITASDNLLHIWDLSNCSNDNSYSISFQSLSSLLDSGGFLHSSPLIASSGPDSESFGGPRNPDNKAFIFDVQPAANSSFSSNSLSSHEGNPFWTSIALALSDGLSNRPLSLRF
jgi:hypothetical protein